MKLRNLLAIGALGLASLTGTPAKAHDTITHKNDYKVVLGQGQSAWSAVEYVLFGRNKGSQRPILGQRRVNETLIDSFNHTLHRHALKDYDKHSDNTGKEFHWDYIQTLIPDTVEVGQIGEYVWTDRETASQGCDGLPMDELSTGDYFWIPGRNIRNQELARILDGKDGNRDHVITADGTPVRVPKPTTPNKTVGDDYLPPLVPALPETTSENNEAPLPPAAPLPPTGHKNIPLWKKHQPTEVPLPPSPPTPEVREVRAQPIIDHSKETSRTQTEEPREINRNYVGVTGGYVTESLDGNPFLSGPRLNVDVDITNNLNDNWTLNIDSENYFLKADFEEADGNLTTVNADVATTFNYKPTANLSLGVGPRLALSKSNIDYSGNEMSLLEAAAGLEGAIKLETDVLDLKGSYTQSMGTSGDSIQGYDAIDRSQLELEGTLHIGPAHLTAGYEVQKDSQNVRGVKRDNSEHTLKAELDIDVTDNTALTAGYRSVNHNSDANKTDANEIKGGVKFKW